MKSVALFGGSFDPPHIGHTAIVSKLLELPYIDEVVVMPTYRNPFKDSFHAPASLRLSWLQKIFEDEKRVIVSDFETKQNRAVSTYETVLELEKKYDKIYVTIGADNVASLKKWHNYEELKNKVAFLVVMRRGYGVQTHYPTIELDVAISSTQLRKNPQERFLPPKVAQQIMTYYKENNENTH
jgi:nicotinate-nucleotide adenylyltransferase